MWILIDKNEDIIPLKNKKVFTVGRFNTDVILNDDKSISRKHATITIVEDEKSKIPQCLITDNKSTYGTFIVNKNTGILKKLTSESHAVSNNDIIKFGMMHHDYTFIYTDLYKYWVLTSTLIDSEREKLIKILDDIDGKLCSSMNTLITHLTCTTVKLTHKTTYALANAIPIVNIKFWEELHTAIKQNKRKLPLTNSFNPPLDNKVLNELVDGSLNLNLNRKNIFSGLKFVLFDNDQYKYFSKIIETAGGEAIFYVTNTTVTLKDCSSDNVIILAPPDDDDDDDDDGGGVTTTTVETYQLFRKKLKSLGRRPIPESDIALAVLHCSREKFCNPSFSYEKNLKSKGINDKILLAPVIAKDTQSLPQKKIIKNPTIIPESVDPNSVPHIIPETVESQSSEFITPREIESKFVTSTPMVGNYGENFIPESQFSCIDLDDIFESTPSQVPAQKKITVADDDRGNTQTSLKSSGMNNVYQKKKDCGRKVPDVEETPSFDVPEVNPVDSLPSKPSGDSEKHREESVASKKRTAKCVMTLSDDEDQREKVPSKRSKAADVKSTRQVAERSNANATTSKPSTVKPILSLDSDEEVPSKKSKAADARPTRQVSERPNANAATSKPSTTRPRFVLDSDEEDQNKKVPSKKSKAADVNPTRKVSERPNSNATTSKPSNIRPRFVLDSDEEDQNEAVPSKRSKISDGKSTLQNRNAPAKSNSNVAISKPTTSKPKLSFEDHENVPEVQKSKCNKSAFIKTKIKTEPLGNHQISGREEHNVTRSFKGFVKQSFIRVPVRIKVADLVHKKT